MRGGIDPQVFANLRNGAICLFERWRVHSPSLYDTPPRLVWNVLERVRKSGEGQRIGGSNPLSRSNSFLFFQIQQQLSSLFFSHPLVFPSPKNLG